MRKIRLKNSLLFEQLDFLLKACPLKFKGNTHFKDASYLLNCIYFSSFKPLEVEEFKCLRSSTCVVQPKHIRTVVLGRNYLFLSGLLNSGLVSSFFCCLWGLSTFPLGFLWTFSLARIIVTWDI